MENNLAPIVLFVYNRLEHTKGTIEALKNNKLASESDLYIFSDGPKNEKDVSKINELRNYISTVTGFKKVTVIESEKNQGLATSVTKGVTKVIDIYGKVIVVEDDLVTKPNFLEYMNDSLEHYKYNKNVYSISGYSFTDNSYEGLEDTYFLKIVSSWSWATWKDRWAKFDNECSGSDELDTNRVMRYNFNLSNSYNYYTIMKLQKNGLVDSWAIKWYWSVFKNQGLTLFPKSTLVANSGFDGSGTHCGIGENAEVDFTNNNQLELTEDIEESKLARKYIVKIMNKKKRAKIKYAFTRNGIAFIRKKLSKRIMANSGGRVNG